MRRLRLCFYGLFTSGNAAGREAGASQGSISPSAKYEYATSLKMISAFADREHVIIERLALDPRFNDREASC